MKSKRLAVVDSSTMLDTIDAETAYRAYRMRQEGMSLFEIAEQLEITEKDARTGIKLNMDKAAELIADGTRAQMLSMEVSRLDSLQNAVWPAAMAGDTRSVESALKIISQRAKLLGLEATTVENLNQTLVVAGDSKTYIEALKAIANGTAG